MEVKTHEAEDGWKSLSGRNSMWSEILLNYTLDILMIDSVIKRIFTIQELFSYAFW